MVIWFCFRNFHTKLKGQEATSMDVMLHIESLRTQYHVKGKPFYKLLGKIIEHLDTLQRDGIPSHDTVKRGLKKVLVGVTITYVFRHKTTGRVEKHTKAESIPLKRYNRRHWSQVYTVAQERERESSV